MAHVKRDRENRSEKMTLHAQTEFTIPEETVRVARAAYPHGNTLMKMRDALGTIYQDQSFASLFPHNGRGVEAPWRLALITVLQFMEELPDRQAADAVRGRIDWKYLLGLELTDPGFDAGTRQYVKHGKAPRKPDCGRRPAVSPIWSLAVGWKLYRLG